MATPFLSSPVIPGTPVTHGEHRSLLILLVIVVIVALLIGLLLLANPASEPAMLGSSAPAGPNQEVVNKLSAAVPPSSVQVNSAVSGLKKSKPASSASVKSAVDQLKAQ